ncbi:hypothetical protein OEZ85_001630 [Tetradesmus obliquus]|uniref:Uncharacterized protein n=1 Tax=Tetradesmus obliquus TaxID=3088 RepID=A0ABY8U0E6_TETOB|nr:hypothetical protein OEZ85_001630 [Tetradesmus obliquus]
MSDWVFGLVFAPLENVRADKAASDSLQGPSSLMSLGLIMRNALELLRGMSISIEAGVLTVAVFSLVEWFTVGGGEGQ